MEIYQIIFEIVLYLTEGAMIYYYSKSFFETKYNNLISILGISLGYTILFFVYQFDKAYINVIAILIINSLIFITLYKCKFKTAAFHSSLLLVIMLSCEVVLIFIISSILKIDFNSYQINYNIHILNVVSSKLVYYIIILLLTNIFSKLKLKRTNDSTFWILFIMPFSSLFILLVFRYLTFETEISNTMNIISSCAFVLLLLSNIVVFIIYQHSISNSQKLFELEAQKQKEEIDKKYFDILEQNNKELKMFTHDIKNHLEHISNLIDNKDAIKYINKIYGAVNHYGYIALSGNKTLDIIISKYNSLASNKSISISFNVKTSNLSNLDDVDLSTIMNNLLDNAIEASQESYNKKISVDIITKNSFDVIKIQNSCDTEPIISNRKLLTSKNNKSMHGFGIESVSTTLKKYNGFLDWIYDSELKIFEITVAIPKQEKASPS